MHFMLFGGKKSMSQRSDNNNHIPKWTGKANIQYFFQPTVKKKYFIYLMECILSISNMFEKQRRHLV